VSKLIHGKRIVSSFGAFAVLLMLFIGINNAVAIGYNGTIFTAGYYGSGTDTPEDPATLSDVIPAYHPEDASLDDYVVEVYVVGSDNDAQIRIAISTNDGSSFSTFEWVAYDPEVKQDYPDVQLYEDVTDNYIVKAIVVWQERPDDDSEQWEIKAREREFQTNTWKTVKDVSDTGYQENDNANIYPKISTCSDNGASYWNIVWQRKWDGVNTYGIYMRRYIKDNNPGSFNSIVTIAQPSDNDDDFKHPATDCIPYSNNYEMIYIIYDEYHSGDTPDNIIKLKMGYPAGSARGAFSVSGNVDVNTSDDGDLSQDFPDIAVVESDDGKNIIVDCVWIENIDNNDEVKYKRSTNGGTSFSENYQISDDGYMSLRSVAVDSFVSPTVTGSVERCHVVWTTSTDVYFRDRFGIDGSWGFFGSQTDGATTQYSETFVDVSTSATSPSVITSYAVWQADGTAVFYGYT